jgi:UDP-N-acetyl-D-glucosamine dehydrogenase
MRAINVIADRIPVVFPVHPRTAPRLKDLELHPRIRIVEPMSYLPFLGLVARSHMVLTDSGGIQEETTVLGIPCLTMRPNTERPITCEIGTNVLVGTDPQRILHEANSILDGHTRPGAVPEKWDGRAAERIVEILLNQSVQDPCTALCADYLSLVTAPSAMEIIEMHPTIGTTTQELLADRILTRKAKVGVIGLGYVGLPLAVEFANAGFCITGVDVQRSKVEELNAGCSYIQDVPSEVVRQHVDSGHLRASTDFSVIAEMDTINIAVPTPLRKTKDPDMSYVVAAAEQVAKYIHPGMLVVLESTTYPGTTEELLLPMFEKGGLKAGEDFFLCFSPERVDPGNPQYQTRNIPKVVGGITPACTEMGALFYSQALDTVVRVSSTSVAEMVKLLENTFRMINIGLVNEMALMCDWMRINVWEVIDAAATKPFGFMPFYPGPGLGGHCIPIDPFYLSWKTKQAGVEARFIELAGYINGSMPHFVVDKVQNALNDHAKPLKGSHIHIAGVAYKRDIDDLRESPALDIILLLEQRGARVTYTDPYIPALRLNGHGLASTNLEENAAVADCVVIVTDHRDFDYKSLVDRAKLVVDTRNALKSHVSAKIVRL